MRIFYLGDYAPGYEIAKFLKEKGETFVGLGIHPPSFTSPLNAGFTQKIVDVVDISPNLVFKGEELHNSVKEIAALKPDLIISIMWNYILKADLIRIPSKGCINCHLSYLPFNRGRNPNVWPLVEGSPAGVTLHYIDEGIDSGEIISQKQVSVDWTDTGKSLHGKLLQGAVDLFKESWEKIKKGEIQKKAQEKGTFHLGRDLRKLDEIDLNKSMLVKDVINLLRARTFRPFPSAYFIDEHGQKIYVRVDLEKASS